jgi:hypothetical protein
MLDDTKLRKKVLLRLLGNPLTVFPFLLGMSTMMATWAMNWRPSLGFFAGLAGFLGSAGAYVSQLLINGDDITKQAAAELEQEENSARQKHLDDLDQQLTHADNDTRPEVCLRELRTLLKAFEESEDDPLNVNRASVFEVQTMVRQLFDRCVESLRQSDRLWQTAASLQTPGARKPILSQREKIISEIQESIKHLSQTLVALQTLDRGTDSSAELTRLRGELDQSLTIARTVEERVNALVSDSGANALKTLNNPTRG